MMLGIACEDFDWNQGNEEPFATTLYPPPFY
jgi:hypothetical protein